MPPEQHTLPTHLSAKVITELSQEFDIDALLHDEKETFKGTDVLSSLNCQLGI